VGSFFGECLAVHTEDPADGPYIVGAAPLTSKPHHFPGRLPDRLRDSQNRVVDECFLGSALDVRAPAGTSLKVGEFWGSRPSAVLWASLSPCACT
jgi:hypothetical protein